MTTEDKLYINPQPEISCPTIDKGIRELKWANGYIKDISNQLRYEYETVDIESLITSVEYELDGLDEILEYCRSQAEALREWGQQWKDLAKELLKEYEPERLEEK